MSPAKRPRKGGGGTKTTKQGYVPTTPTPPRTSAPPRRAPPAPWATPLAARTPTALEVRAQGRGPTTALEQFLMAEHHVPREYRERTTQAERETRGAAERLLPPALAPATAVNAYLEGRGVTPPPAPEGVRAGPTQVSAVDAYLASRGVAPLGGGVSPSRGQNQDVYRSLLAQGYTPQQLLTVAGATRGQLGELGRNASSEAARQASVDRWLRTAPEAEAARLPAKGVAGWKPELPMRSPVTGGPNAADLEAYLNTLGWENAAVGGGYGGYGEGGGGGGSMADALRFWLGLTRWQYPV